MKFFQTKHAKLLTDNQVIFLNRIMKLNIKELQKEVNDNNMLVSSLLRKSKIIASKLEQKDFLTWIDKELNGYSPDEKVPEYRMVIGIPQGYNPYRGWIPYLINNPENQELISKRGVKQSIGELEEILKSNKSSLMMKYPASVEKTLREGISSDVDLRLLIGKASVAGILEHVRNDIQDWTIKLEVAGISNESDEFSTKDIKEAEDVKPKYEIQHIENFTGNIGEHNKFESGSLVPVETFWNKFFWYVIIALIVVIVGNIISALILKNVFNI